MKKRVLSLLLTLVMLVGLFPTTALAADETQPCSTEGCEYALDHEGNCSNYVAPCDTEGCTYAAGHDGNHSNFVACETEGCTYALGHEGNCSNYVAPCDTEGCTYAAGHDGNHSNFVACETEGCTYAAGHEGDHSTVAPSNDSGNITLESISLNKNELALTVGGSETLTATLSPEGAAGEVTWTSSDTNIATVENGVVTAAAAGTATITAAVGEISASCALTVSAAAEEPEAITAKWMVWVAEGTTVEANGQSVEAGSSVTLLLVDESNSPISGATPTAVVGGKTMALSAAPTGEDGKVSVTIPETIPAGNYVLGATGLADNITLSSAAVTVTAKPAAQSLGLSSLTVAIGRSSGFSASPHTTLDIGEFNTETTAYSVDELEFLSSSNRFVLIKATATDSDAVITASLGDVSTTVVSGSDYWSNLAYAYVTGYIYGNPFQAGTTNVVTITVTSGEESKTYTVNIPMAPDPATLPQLGWAKDLPNAIYFTKESEALLTVEAEYKNRPEGNEDVVTYQWYRSSSAEGTDGASIDGANTASYSPSTAAPGTTYYYVVASCNGLESITSKTTAVTISDKTAPKSVSVICLHPYKIENDWVKALGGYSYIATLGDTIQLRAVDENGVETPVTWSSTKVDPATSILTYDSAGYVYLTATSLFDSSIKSEEKAVVVEDYKISQYNKAQTVVLSNDGQTAKTASMSGGIKGHTDWVYEVDKNVAECTSDLSTKDSRLNFNLYRPGEIKLSFTLDLGGENDPKLTDSGTITIAGVAVETDIGGRVKTYLEMGSSNPAPTVQLKAYTTSADAKVTWSSADESIAKVDENGVVTAVGVGSVIISASDGTYTGGIKVVVTSADTPYFEALDFTTTSAWSSGLSNATWSSSKFKPTTLSYSGLKMTQASASTLAINKATLFDSTKYIATASYTDADGKAQNIEISSGAATNLPGIPFGTSTITITLANKTDSSKKTVYTFEISRPRDTSKTIKASGVVLIPDGRSLLTTKYNNYAEGTMFLANSDGSLAQYINIRNNHYYYRSFAQEGLEAFSLNISGANSYVRVRYSVDDGTNWTELPQGGGTTAKISFPERVKSEEGETAFNPVVKIRMQFLDDKTYTDNINSEKEGFADSTPTEYTLWVEQLPPPEYEADMVTATVDTGAWSPSFDTETISYRIIIPNGGQTPVLTYTVTEFATVKIGDEEQTPNENGEYTFAIERTPKSITITSKDGKVKEYSFAYTEKSTQAVPDNVVDYLPINSQYTNGNGGGYGIVPEQTLSGGSGLSSLGNFGGYITYYYDEPLTNNANNKYGIDFYIYGNAFEDVSTGTGKGSMEPGQVWVSEDGVNWYALAGSEHYEDSTIWDYQVTYTKNDNGLTSWTDNYGNSDNGSQVGQWPDPSKYPHNSSLKENSITLSGILLPCIDGSITGNGEFMSLSNGAKFGYVDTLVNSAEGADANPYLANDDYTLPSSGFDLAWAVDANGNPVDVSGKQFHYVKVVTASNLWAGAANEKSTEVGSVVRTTAQSEAVGITSAPSGVTISCGEDSQTINFVEGQQTYSADLGDMEYISILVNGTASDDNIYVNNTRVASGTAAQGIRVTKDASKMVRIIVQNGDKEPVIYMLNLSSDASTEDDLLTQLCLTVSGSNYIASTVDGKIYTAAVTHRVAAIGINPQTVAGTTVTINGKAPFDSYDVKEGENTFTIVITKGEISQSVTLKVTRDKVPESTGEITVYFSLLGDSVHGSGTVHTLANGGLTTWIPRTEYKINSPALVVDLLEMALAGKYSIVNSGGNYVSSIGGLSEFANGANSGWMYTINGVHSSQGVGQQLLADGDVVVFHYTDDYKQENYGGAYEDENKVATVESLINAIGTVSLDSKAKIDAAREAYDGLSFMLKREVENYSVLTAAETKYAELKKEADEKAAEEVDKLIKLIATDPDKFEEEVTAARKAYNALTDEQKELVKNYKLLVDAEKKLATEEDKKIAKEVEKLIDAIGKNVTLESKAKIEAARVAYNKLTDVQKALVENYADLEAAEEALAKLEDLEKSLDIYKLTGDYLEKLGTPTVANVGGEWMVLGLARSDRKVADGYYDNVVKFVQENIDDNERLHSAKSSENSRVILALTSIGKDVTNVDGHNLLMGLTDMDYVQKQGINGSIWALIAFDSGNYPVPEGNVSRAALIDTILAAQLDDGGWALSGKVSDPDMTGMALTALAPYYANNDKAAKPIVEKYGKERTAEIKKAVEAALKTLSEMQDADGGFSSIDGANCESIAQVIVALSALGIDADTDRRFIKKDVSALDALCTYFVENSGFCHVPGTGLDGMATEQAYYALTAYFRMLDDKSALFDMTEIIDKGGDKEPVKVEEPKTEKVEEESKPAPTEAPKASESKRPSFWQWLKNLFS